MPRITKGADAAAVQPTTLVVDNGGWSIKAGLVAAQPSVDSCDTVPNCIGRDQDRRVYVGAQLDRCKDYYHVVLRRPIERGMVVNWELERAIWHTTFLSEKEARVKVRDFSLFSPRAALIAARLVRSSRDQPGPDRIPQRLPGPAGKLRPNSLRGI
jgi:actin-related protein